MDDKQMLELAAKAAGGTLEKVFDRHACEFVWNWNPLTDDGDRYRLAKKLNIDIDFSGCFVAYFCDSTNSDRIIGWGGDGNPVDDAHAVVFAAAEIGKNLG